MVAYAEDRKQKDSTRSTGSGQAGSLPAAGMVCPVCNNALPTATVINEWRRDGIEMRSYVGFCHRCNVGCETIQFLWNNRWRVHKYKPYGYATSDYSEPPKPIGEWVTLNDPPKAGGEIGDMEMELLRTLRKSLEGVCQTIRCLMKHKGLSE